MLAAHGGVWYVHVLSRGPVGRNHKAVTDCAALADGDVLHIGPLVVRVELRPATAERPVPAAVAAEVPAPAPAAPPEPPAFYAAGQRLDGWLRTHLPGPPAGAAGLGTWLGVGRQLVGRFWSDVPEAAAARRLRNAGRADEAFAVLDRAVRGRPDSPELLRELYRLYEAAGLMDLCYRPLRQIEKLAAARGKPDPWVLEALARTCEKLSGQSATMSDRAIEYWNKLEAATAVSYSRERTAVLATRALRDGKYAGSGDHDRA